MTMESALEEGVYDSNPDPQVSRCYIRVAAARKQKRGARGKKMENKKGKRGGRKVWVPALSQGDRFCNKVERSSFPSLSPSWEHGMLLPWVPCSGEIALFWRLGSNPAKRPLWPSHRDEVRQFFTNFVGFRAILEPETFLFGTSGRVWKAFGSGGRDVWQAMPGSQHLLPVWILFLTYFSHI